MKSKNYLLQIAQAKVSPTRVSDLCTVMSYIMVDILDNLERINLRIDEVDKQ